MPLDAQQQHAFDQWVSRRWMGAGLPPCPFCESNAWAGPELATVPPVGAVALLVCGDCGNVQALQASAVGLATP